MKRYCGIELKGNDAVLVVLENNNVLDLKIKKITLENSKNQESIKSFNNKINQFFIDNNIDKISIKERATKGRFAGGSVSFKMEALIQNTKFEVNLINGKTIKAKLKNIDLNYNNIMKYQEGALQVTYYSTII